MLKRTFSGLVLFCCVIVLSQSAGAFTPCDGKQCNYSKTKVAQVTSDKKFQCYYAAAKVAQVKSDKKSQCCTDAAKVAQVAQVKSDAAPQCAATATAARVAQVKSQECAAKCAAAKAARVAQVKSVKQTQCCSFAAKAAQVAQVKSDAAPQCSASAKAARVAQVTSQECAAKCAAAKAARVAQVKSTTANAKYVAFGCNKTDALVRKAAMTYLKAVNDLQKASGASACSLDAASKTLAVVIKDMMAKYQTETANATIKTKPVATTISLGSISGCGPDCTKACCTN